VSDDLSIPSPTYRVSRQRYAMDPATRRLALIAGGLGAVLLAVAGGWTVMGRHNASVPVVQADNRPIRVKPDNPGGLQVAGANEDILSGGTEAKDGKLAPPPEAPAPQALRAPPPPPAPPAVAAPAPAPAPIATATPAPAKPLAAKPAEPVQDKRPAPPAAANTAVQLAAVHTEDAAKSEWQKLSKRLPDLLGPRHPAFSKVERGGQTLWRVRTGGFSDVSQANSFCEKVRAKGAACAVAEF